MIQRTSAIRLAPCPSFPIAAAFLHAHVDMQCLLDGYKFGWLLAHLHPHNYTTADLMTVTGLRPRGLASFCIAPGSHGIKRSCCSTTFARKSDIGMSNRQKSGRRGIPWPQLIYLFSATAIGGIVFACGFADPKPQLICRQKYAERKAGIKATRDVGDTKLYCVTLWRSRGNSGNESQNTRICSSVLDTSIE